MARFQADSEPAAARSQGKIDWGIAILAASVTLVDSWSVHASCGPWADCTPAGGPPDLCLDCLEAIGVLNG